MRKPKANTARAFPTDRGLPQRSPENFKSYPGMARTDCLHDRHSGSSLRPG